MGMLLDHGMDAVTAVVNNFILQRVMQTGNGDRNMLGMLVSTMPFYYAMLQQYYTGDLVLQVVNGVDDGSFLYIGLCFASAYYGNEIWLSKVKIGDYPEMYVNDIIIYILFTVLSISTLD